ncbi:hypothetical protein M413DRAFT_18928 [Hebeloma cylindrosporum]|uniref:NAD(P)-binding protein n=1 Tax=Hebeloma cylindrosporum TaxID=76867 RepID=A0A0C3BXP2_HEBCY|nr:hypothetical protein M413DRAFT_18928 [Hebeloma cylindrosporum h7]
MPSFSVAKSTNESYTPAYIPTILITGATSGIGEAIVKSLANHLHGRGHFILVGRNRAAAESIIASLPPSAQDSTYEFIACDVSLMKNVHALAKDLLERLPKLNFLVHSAGVFGILGLEETEEGIDKKLASRYYARWALTHDLLPLLRNAKDQGEPASVLSVLGAGMGGQVDLDDLGLKKSYSGIKAMMQSLSYNDLMVAEFARREPNIAFTHIYPGNVNTAMYKPSNPIYKIIVFFLRPVIWLITTTPEACAEHMIFALLDADKGMYRRNEKGDDIAMKGFPTPAGDEAKKEQAQKALWDHSLQVTTV